MILAKNFVLIDSLFGNECPLCAVNMKKMWCMYTCGNRTRDYVKGTGYLNNTVGNNYTLTNFTMDTDYACVAFKSCAKTSFISAANLQSSLAFLDFMGLNGKDNGLSIISFGFNDYKNGSALD